MSDSKFQITLYNAVGLGNTELIKDILTTPGKNIPEHFLVDCTIIAIKKKDIKTLKCMLEYGNFSDYHLNFFLEIAPAEMSFLIRQSLKTEENKKNQTITPQVKISGI